MKYLLALGFLGTAMGQTYVQVSSGTCESNGYEAITDAAECETAGKSYVYTNWDGTPNGRWTGSVNDAGYPSNCLPVPNTAEYFESHTTPHTFFNTNDNNHECDESSYRACLCRVPAGGGGYGGNAQTNTPGGGGSCDPSTCTGCTPAEYINAQCCQC